MRDGVVAHQFDDLEQQNEADRLGMWVFLITEVLFFGGMFTAYIEYRTIHPQAFSIASHHLDYWMGTINTALLLVSSMTMALAVHGAQRGKRWISALFLFCTIVLGLGFLGVKFWEYAKHINEGLVPGRGFKYMGPYAREVELFMSFYFLMTGMHALHMTIGVCVVTVMLLLTLAGKITRVYHSPIVIAGLYWHFVDIVWIFLYPCFYLIGGPK
ncbi:MAG TPA: cytochrome c oxidase subunit 3 family protein [Thermoanaerobaculia bacterium]|nr:cytochrome c oxidase subunit 3 family protein [Thermoanaerobaculia bacterium]